MIEHRFEPSVYSPISIWSASLRLKKIRPARWLGLFAVSFALFCFAFFVGAAAPALDVGEQCAAAGQIYDRTYQIEHIGESGKLFPMHNKCNAKYDLVPAWVNPALVGFGVLSVGFLAGMSYSFKSYATHYR